MLHSHKWRIPGKKIRIIAHIKIKSVVAKGQLQRKSRAGSYQYTNMNTSIMIVLLGIIATVVVPAAADCLVGGDVSFSLMCTILCQNNVIWYIYEYYIQLKLAFPFFLYFINNTSY